jgi:hypothetical protein
VNGLAGLAGSLGAPIALGSLSAWNGIALSTVLEGLAIGLLGSPVPSGFVLGLGLGLQGLADNVRNVFNVTLRQRIIPAFLRGRVNSLIRFFLIGAFPVSGLLYGICADVLGPALTLALAGVAVSAIGVVMVLKGRTGEVAVHED